MRKSKVRKSKVCKSKVCKSKVRKSKVRKSKLKRKYGKSLKKIGLAALGLGLLGTGVYVANEKRRNRQENLKRIIRQEEERERQEEERERQEEEEYKKRQTKIQEEREQKKNDINNMIYFYDCIKKLRPIFEKDFNPSNIIDVFNVQEKIKTVYSNILNPDENIKKNYNYYSSLFLLNEKELRNKYNGVYDITADDIKLLIKEQFLWNKSKLTDVQYMDVPYAEFINANQEFIKKFNLEKKQNYNTEEKSENLKKFKEDLKTLKKSVKFDDVFKKKFKGELTYDEFSENPIDYLKEKKTRIKLFFLFHPDKMRAEWVEEEYKEVFNNVVRFMTNNQNYNFGKFVKRTLKHRLSKKRKASKKRRTSKKRKSIKKH